MKTNVLNWMMAAAVVYGLSLSLTACSDDDDNGMGVNGERGKLWKWTEAGYPEAELVYTADLMNYSYWTSTPSTGFGGQHFVVQHNRVLELFRYIHQKIRPFVAFTVNE